MKEDSLRSAAGSAGVKAPDWLKAVDAANAATGDQFDLRQLEASDHLRVTSSHTVYTFRIVDPVMRDVVVESNREDRPSGPARIMGCTFGLSSSIKPDHLFCGGNLEFTHQNGERIHTTTAIRKVEWLRVTRDDG